MTEKRVLVISSACREVIRAIVEHVDGSEVVDRIEVIDGSERHRRGPALADILGEIEEYMVSMPNFLKLDPQEQKLLYLCCLMALYRELLAAHHRACDMGVQMHLTLLAYILARDGPQFGDIP